MHLILTKPTSLVNWAATTTHGKGLKINGLKTRPNIIRHLRVFFTSMKVIILWVRGGGEPEGYEGNPHS